MDHQASRRLHRCTLLVILTGDSADVRRECNCNHKTTCERREALENVIILLPTSLREIEDSDNVLF